MVSLATDPIHPSFSNPVQNRGPISLPGLGGQLGEGAKMGSGLQLMSAHEPLACNDITWFFHLGPLPRTARWNPCLSISGAQQQERARSLTRVRHGGRTKQEHSLLPRVLLLACVSVLKSRTVSSAITLALKPGICSATIDLSGNNLSEMQIPYLHVHDFIHEKY